MQNRIENVDDLKVHMNLTEEETSIRKCLGTLRMAITPYYLSLINPNDPNDPVRRLVHNEKVYLEPKGLRRNIRNGSEG